MVSTVDRPRLARLSRHPAGAPGCILHGTAPLAEICLRATPKRLSTVANTYELLVNVSSRQSAPAVTACIHDQVVCCPRLYGQRHTKTVQVRNSESGEETYRDVCPKHYEQIHREDLSASWDPILAAVRLT